jgi:phage baseplate assembly protein W
MPLYKGFSTYNRTKNFRVTDFELAKQDLFNHLHIRKGELVMNPNFGTIIWGLLFEPLTQEVKDAMLTDLNYIISYDPRLSTDNITIAEYQQGIQVMIELTFVETDETDTMRIQFDRNAQL